MIDHPEVPPETILPVQLIDGRFAGARLQGEKRLQLAVLTDALMVYARSHAATDRHQTAAFAEVDAWLRSDATDGPFTFITICDSLDLEPTYVRRALGNGESGLGLAGRRRLVVRRDTRSRHRVLGPRIRKVA